jgi:hypothetical protein
MRIRNLPGLPAFCLVVAVLMPAVDAQIVAKGAETSEFHSPMVLTIPFKDITIVDRTHWEFPDLRKYICDGVNIKSLEFKVEKMPATDSGKMGKLAVKGELHLRPGKDRNVDLQIELLHGEDVVTSKEKNGIGIEEDESSHFTTDIPVIPFRYHKMVADGEKASVKITMRVK